MIRDVLIPRLKSEFPGWEITFGNPPDPIAIFPAAHEAVGNLLIYDEGDEATIVIEKITHTQFHQYGEPISEEEYVLRVTNQVIDFLKALFAEKILLFIHNKQPSNGWMEIEHGPVEIEPNNRYFLWSGPFKTT